MFNEFNKNMIHCEDYEIHTNETIPETTQDV